MKRIYLLLIALMFLLTSCSLGGLNKGFPKDNDEQVTKDTFKQVFNAIQHHDETALKNLFTKKVRNEVSNFDESTVNFLDFFQGKVISFDDQEGDAVDGIIENGKKRMYVESIYDVNTSEQKYHIAIKVCTVDTYDSNNVGITSIYIINAENWNETYDYRGDAKWTPGIVIDQKKE